MLEMRVDLRLYALVDPEHASVYSLPDLARRVVQGGATLVQLRDKRGQTREMVAQARAIKAVLAPLGVPFIVNDRVDVTLASGAHGVHLGQDDMDAADARRLLGPEAIIGLSVKTMPEAQAAPLQHLSYVAIGAVFPTTSKDNPRQIGAEGLRQIAAEIRARMPGFPVGAIAGVRTGAPGPGGPIVRMLLQPPRNRRGSFGAARCDRSLPGNMPGLDPD